MPQASTIESSASLTRTAEFGEAKSAKSRHETPAASKTDLVLKKLRTAKGATVAGLTEVTGWQAHSVRGFLSGTVKKKLGLSLISEVGKDGIRRYRIVAHTKAA